MPAPLQCGLFDRPAPIAPPSAPKAPKAARRPRAPKASHVEQDVESGLENDNGEPLESDAGASTGAGEAAEPLERPDVERWNRAPVDRSGAAAYVVIIRAAGDPERKPRDGSDRGSAWRRALVKMPVERLADEIAAHLADGVPRTMNRIGVEMMDKTADCTFGTPFEEALWALVERGTHEHTLDAPILFRAVAPA
jgi:hypothetical protein